MGPQATDNRARLKRGLIYSTTTLLAAHESRRTGATQQATSSDAVLTHLIVIIEAWRLLSKRLDDNEKTFDQLAITGSDRER